MVGITSMEASNMRLTVENLEWIEFNKPTDQMDNATRTQGQIWDKEVD